MTAAFFGQSLLPIRVLCWAMAGALVLLAEPAPGGEVVDVLAEFRDPPREFAVMPFWFWNDDFKKDELRRQITDFEAPDVYGFVMHPHVGLPKHIGWMLLWIDRIRTCNLVCCSL